MKITKKDVEHVARLAIVSGAILLSSFLDTIAAEPHCPEPPNKVVVTITPTVTSNPSGYTYSYRLKNDQSSAQDIQNFIVRAKIDYPHAKSPKGWGYIPGNVRSGPTAAWYAESMPIINNKPDEDAPSPDNIKPGAALTGFSFESVYPPFNVKYYVAGAVLPLVATSEAEAEEITEDCKNSVGALEDIAKSGYTTGPADPDVNRDGLVNSSDIAILKSSWDKKCEQPGYTGSADLNGDCTVDKKDFDFVNKFMGKRFPL